MARTWTLFILDTVLFAALICLAEPKVAGPAVHEWLGLAFAPLIVLHLLYAWPWIAALPARLRARGAWRLRFNMVLNAALFAAFIVTVFSGAMTSFVALPALGVAPGHFQGWLLLHRKWEVYLEIAAALHVALNGDWIAGTARRLLFARPPAPHAARPDMFKSDAFQSGAFKPDAFKPGPFKSGAGKP